CRRPLQLAEGERHGRTVRERDREREREMFLYHIVTIYNLLFVCFIYVNCACTFYVNMLWQRCIVCSHANKAFFEFEFEFDRDLLSRKRERERERERDMDGQ